VWLVLTEISSVGKLELWLCGWIIHRRGESSVNVALLLSVLAFSYCQFTPIAMGAARKSRDRTLVGQW
jgi:hypothetical protein